MQEEKGRDRGETEGTDVGRCCRFHFTLGELNSPIRTQLFISVGAIQCRKRLFPYKMRTGIVHYVHYCK